MRRKKSSFKLTTVTAAIAVAILIIGTSAVAQQETLLHSFNGNGTDGYFPHGGLIFDSAGNLYGTTELGGNGTGELCGFGDGRGVVFELSPSAGGDWTETILHDFGSNPIDGSMPYGGLIFDSAGHSFGTTVFGGTNSGCSGGDGCGTVFELIPAAHGGWNEKILHNFGQGLDGSWPEGTLLLDSHGNLYGTTASGGAYACGTVFELSPVKGAGWSEAVLYSFNNNGKDGCNPASDLVLGSDGEFFGTTSGGGTHSLGTVFELAPKTGGGWFEKVLISFDGRDGANPAAGLTMDAVGVLYGTTLHGGNNSGCGGGGCGTVFELTPTGVHWAEKVLHSFVNNGTDGVSPNAGVILDASGNLYGATVAGGTGTCRGGCGIVFQLSPSVGGNWAETVYSLDSSLDGFAVYGGVILDASGNFYGTTVDGGPYYGGGTIYGTVFEIKP